MDDVGTGRREHWDRIYRSMRPEDRSWFQPQPAVSLALIRGVGCGPSTRIVDIGGGTSRLVDLLVADGCRSVTVVDVGPAALAEARSRSAYLRVLNQSLYPGGHAIVATFAEDGPTRCSGLPVVRYSPSSLGAELGANYELVRTRDERHVTPQGREQHFVYCLFRVRT